MLLSINPEYVERIISGEKVYEYRKTKCRKDVDKIIIYETSPCKKIVAEADLAEVLEDDVLSVWHKTKKYSGVTYKFYRKYYKGKKKAVAYHLINVVVYSNPIDLEELGVSCAPQSFCYLTAK